MSDSSFLAMLIFIPIIGVMAAICFSGWGTTSHRSNVSETETETETEAEPSPSSPAPTLPRPSPPPAPPFASDSATLPRRYLELKRYEEALGLHLNPSQEDVVRAHKKKIQELNCKEAWSSEDDELVAHTSFARLKDEPSVERATRYFEIAQWMFENKFAEHGNQYLTAGRSLL